MNNDDLIEKLKIMLAERMLEIEELKRDVEDEKAKREMEEEAHSETKGRCDKLYDSEGKLVDKVDDLGDELESEKKKSDYLDKQCQMLSHKIKVLEDEKKDRYPGFGQLCFYPKDEPGFELRGRLRDLKQPIDILFQHLPSSEVVILGKAPSRYHCGGGYFFETTNELMKEKSEV